MSIAMNDNSGHPAHHDIIIRKEGRAGRITLNRPRALNALTYPQMGEINSALTLWENDPEVHLVILDGTGERAMCAGGDILAMYESRTDGPAYANLFWHDEYHLNLRISKYPKPYVALMDGLVMGGGVGLAGHASHRIVTERSGIAMPETTIGLVPDAGGSWLLASAPGHLGEYYGLLGERMASADALYAGFADTHIDAEKLPGLIAALTDPNGDAVSITIAEFAGSPTNPLHSGRQSEIDAIFSASTVAEIRSRISASGLEWAEKAIKGLDQRSPLSLALALASIREARRLGSLANALDIEFRLTTRLFAHGEFLEGIRALLIDKDRAPKWNPPTTAGVTTQMIADFMTPLPAGEELGLTVSERR